jgi:hypothetical protein
MADKQFPRDTHLTSIAVAYKNPDFTYIADAALPRVNVGKKSFGYTEYPVSEMYDIPDTRVGEYSRVPLTRVSGKRVTSECEGYGQGIPLSNDDISEAPTGCDPKERATERATNIVLTDRERRVANMLFNATNYPDAVKVDVAAGSKWDTDTVNVIKVIRTGLAKAYIRPNVLVFGADAWNAIAMQQTVVSACLGNDGKYGVATQERFAELCGVSEVLVGQSVINSVKPGKAPVLAPMWGKHCLGLYRDRSVDTTGGVTFGFTAQWGTRVAGSAPIDIGTNGGVEVRCTENVKELIIAPYACYFWQNVIA